MGAVNRVTLHIVSQAINGKDAGFWSSFSTCELDCLVKYFFRPESIAAGVLQDSIRKGGRGQLHNSGAINELQTGYSQGRHREAETCPLYVVG